MRRPDVFTLDYSHPLAQGLVFAWLGRRVGPYVDDVSIRRQNAEVVVGSGSIVDYHDGGLDWLRFIQSTGKLSVPAMSADVGACTVSFWLAGVSGALYPRLFAINGATKIYGYHDKSTSRLLLNRGTTRYTLAANPISPQHLAIVHDGAGLLVYIDGVLRTAETSTVSLTTVSDGGFGNVILGGTTYADDAIAQPFFHNRALSPAEIALLADRTDPMLGGLIVEERPVLYFDMGGSTEVEGPAVITAEASIAASGSKQATSSATVTASASLGMGGVKQAVAPLNIVGTAAVEASGIKSASSPATITATADFLASGIKTIIGLDKEGTAVVTASVTVGMGGVKGGVGATALGADLAVEVGGAKGAISSAQILAAFAFGVAGGNFLVSEGPAVIAASGALGFGGIKGAASPAIISTSQDVLADGIKEASSSAALLAIAEFFARKGFEFVPDARITLPSQVVFEIVLQSYVQTNITLPSSTGMEMDME